MGDPARNPVLLTSQDLAALLAALASDGFTLIGPTVRDGAIVYDEIEGLGDLPRGVSDEQAPGRYRLSRRADDALFGHVVGPHSWKRFLHPPAVRLLGVSRDGKALAISPPDCAPPPRYAFIGARPCDLAAIARQDRVFLGGPFVDPTYRALRDGVFVVAVQCGEARASCFCASVGTGPRADAGFDVALTELAVERSFEYLAEIGTDRGAALVAKAGGRKATPEDLERAAAASRRAEAQMTRRLEVDGLREALAASLESPRWEEIAKKCLSCANCTMVCPTCFCATVEDTTDLTGDRAERWRRWDSCFTMDFSYIHGGSIRRSAASRYRQWLTHKLSTWWDQFGASGCVGCGRCITWCPVGIDLTEEAAALRKTARPA
ncbi:MAG TPA: 4Fe-4S dicluster domain-containing protein [Thermoanaerobaculia bacterium]|jgi:ferredoxin